MKKVKRDWAQIRAESVKFGLGPGVDIQIDGAKIDRQSFDKWFANELRMAELKGCALTNAARILREFTNQGWDEAADYLELIAGKQNESR